MMLKAMDSTLNLNAGTGFGTNNDKLASCLVNQLKMHYFKEERRGCRYSLANGYVETVGIVSDREQIDEITDSVIIGSNGKFESYGHPSFAVAEIPNALAEKDESSF